MLKNVGDLCHSCVGSESPGESDDRQWFFGLDGQDLHGSVCFYP